MALQLAVPSETVTVPVGVPEPDATLTATLYDWPMTDGSGVSLWMVVVVGVPLTV